MFGDEDEPIGIVDKQTNRFTLAICLIIIAVAVFACFRT